MTDELDALKAALGKTPPPDVDAKTEAIARAMKNFDALQGSPRPPRPIQDRPSRAGFLNGVRNMLKSLTSRPALAATASIAALGVGVIVTLPLLDRPQPEGPIVVQPEILPAGPEAVVDNAPTDATPPVGAVTGQLADQPEFRAEQAPAEAAGSQAATERDSAAMLADEAAPGLSAPAPMLQKSAPPATAAPEGGAVGLAMPEPGPLVLPTENTEVFSSLAANPVKVTVEEPVSTFSIDVDTASYAVVRNSLNNGQLPPAEAVRIEEMVNYFPYGYPAPQPGEAPFRSTVTVMPTPWNPGTRLVHIGLQGRLPALEDRPALNLVFLIDTSGSMDEPNKLPLLKQSFKLLLAQLRPEDEVAIVAYAGSAGEVLKPTKAEDTAAILAALDRLSAGGSTAGAEGLALAYQVAERMGGANEVSRVVLATDGDFNVGIDDPEGLTAYIAKKRKSGTYLSVLGFGRGNLDDATMQALAQNGNGQAAYIDTLQEARKTLVDQLTGALFPIANDVKIQVEWNP
ncbi:MAG TPA: von Willebrand factor type A domain-containing protein, partial [Paracoccaceae bacterium]